MPFVPATLDNTLGVLYDASLISSALYGAGCLQAWFYFRKYCKRDSWPIRSVVAFILICDTVQMCLLSTSVYKYTVTNHGDDAALNVIERSLMVELFFSGGIAIATQMFYAWRILALSSNWVLTIAVALLGWTSFVALYVYTIIILHEYKFMADINSQLPLSMTLNACGAACDVAITVGIIFYLERSKTGFQKSTDMINRLIVFTFNTGIPTTLCQITALITQLTLPNTSVYIFFYLLMGRFYTNSILVTLNSREYIRAAGRSETTFNDISLVAFGHGTASRALSRTRSLQEISIRIDTSTINDTNDFKERGDDTSGNVTMVV
ncbi:hypothetical protein CPB85DRAFT_1459962 [Mucidula mucida]|nr:hypothetical protein CPB85DRAFT_1459962 [Mucidula mucida]